MSAAPRGRRTPVRGATGHSEPRTSHQKLGRRQLHILDSMHRYGGNVYLPGWRMSFAQRAILESLLRRGVVVLVAHSSGVQVYRLKENP